MENNPTIALIGYGSMGREIERLAKDQNIEVARVFDQYNPLIEYAAYNFDVAIDFSAPEAVLDNVRILTKMKKNVVLGTTGWYDKIKEIKELTEKHEVGLVWGSNFSIGMQMFFRIVDQAAYMMSKIDGYDILLHELHHSRKKDSPSGTALTLAKKIQRQLASKIEVLEETSHKQIETHQLHVTSSRGGEFPGTHTVYLDSLADTIELTHRARNRSGFALGALTAAKYIHGKKGFYEFSEMLEKIW